MSKTKRSFLERLIGKSENNDSEQEEVINFQTPYNNSQGNGVNLGGGRQQNTTPPSSAFGTGDNFNHNAENSFSRNHQMNEQLPPPSQSIFNTQSQQSDGGLKNDGEWVADQEGQLTIDVYQTEAEIVIKSTIAGVKPEDLDVQINNDMVTIKGMRKKDQDVREEDYYYQECYWGNFSRSIILPVDVQASKAEASLKHGILTIKLPKASSAQARRIQVRSF